MFKGHCHSERGERRGLRFIGRIVAGIAIAVAFALVFGIFVQMLWNWLMPSIFNLGRITYGQAFGLMILARLVFGSMGHHRRGPHGFGMGKHGFYHMPWRGCSKEDAANHAIEDWQHYDAWWNAEGREAFKKFVDNQGRGGTDNAS
jgi:hypothetical protein